MRLEEVLMQKQVRSAVIRILVVFGLLFFLAYYLFNFALTLQNPFVAICFIGLIAWLVITIKADDLNGIFKLLFGGFVFAAILVAIIAFFNSPVFNARTYSSIFTYEERDFAEYTPSLDNIPLLDKASADNIAKRKFGELSDYVSQYKVIDSEQIIYHGKPVRLAVLEHAGFWRWLKNRTTPGYILVDMNTHKAELVRTEKPIVYSETTAFGKNITRYIRSNYKTVMFMHPTAELDENGELYWIAPTYERIVKPFGGKKINGVIVVNAHTGEHVRYTDLSKVPDWIDNVYPSDYIMDMYNYKGKLSNGFWNTLFAKTGMTMTTDGYNYLPIGNDNWIYTGITSVSMADESNIAFILTNKRTMETHYYPVAGAEEYSAMEAAEGEVQHLGYTATFPLLLNIDGVPTYVLSLKDKNELVKFYAMVSVEDYRTLAVDSDINRLKAKYLSLVGGEKYVEETPETTVDVLLSEDNLVEVEGVLSDKHLISIDGNSYIVFRLQGSEDIYMVPAVKHLDLLYIEEGAEIKLSAYKWQK